MREQQPDDDGLTKTTGAGMGRRKLLKTAAAGTAAATVGGGAAYYGTTRRAQAVVLAPLALAVGAHAAVGGGYLIYREVFTGEDKSDEMAGLQADLIHSRMYEAGQEMHDVYDQQVLTQMSNLMQTWDNALYNEGLHAGIEQLNLGNGVSAAKTEAEAAVNDFVATSQKNILDHVGAQNAKMMRIGGRLYNAGETDITNQTSYWHVFNDSSEYTSGTDNPVIPYALDFDQEAATDYTVSETLLDGSTYSYVGFTVASSSGGDLQGGNVNKETVDITTSTHYLDNNNPLDQVGTRTVQVYPPSTGSREVMHNRTEFFNMWNDLQTAASDAISQLDTFFDNIASSYTAGDINLSDIVTPSALADAARDEAEYPMAGAHLASLGMKISGNLMTIELIDDDVVVEGELYTRTQPSGGFIVGGQYDPANIAGPVFLAFQTEFDSSQLDSDDVYNNSTIHFNTSEYNSTEEIPDGETVSQVVELQQEFAILEASDLEGNSLDVVNMSQPGQQTLNTDIQKLSDELDDLAEYQTQILEKQRDLADQSGGGGGLFGDISIGGTGIAAVAGGVGFLYLVAQNAGN